MRDSLTPAGAPLLPEQELRQLVEAWLWREHVAEELERQLGIPQTAADVQRTLALSVAIKPDVKQLALRICQGDLQSADGRVPVVPGKARRKARVLVRRAIEAHPSREELEVFL